MAEFKGTPGPWERETAQDGEYTGPGDNPPGYAGDYYETNHVGHLDREANEWTNVADCYSDADARLVSAAPDLLAACNAVLAYDASILGRAARGDVDLLEKGGAIAAGDDLDRLYDTMVSAARAAIAKALGKDTPS